MFYSQKLHYKLRNTPCMLQVQTLPRYLCDYMIPDHEFVIAFQIRQYSFSSNNKITKRNTTEKYVLRLEFSSWHLLYMGKLLGKKLR